jgi:C4-dicarboxylate-specific signal transduction histidine kinase
MVGALAVCADGMMSARRRAVDEALLPLEALAAKLGRTIENNALAERLLRAEKLAGLGLLAGGMAHALSNPLTAVLGFAELIADTTDEVRVKTDAETIVREALRMRQTVDLLLEFWRPVNRSDEPVDVTKLLHELAEACREKLVNRGVRLVVQACEEAPIVRGSRDRLRQVLEHLLNNAAQAVASAADLRGGEEHAIRLTASQDGRMVHLIVSDTGPGFREPGRVFNPFYTTGQPGEGVGLGLTICYGIVREHGGEISAVNLQPHGAAVVVELPVCECEIVAEKSDVVVKEMACVVSD